MFGFAVPAWAAKALAGVLAALALLLIGRQWGASGVYEDWIEANSKSAGAAVKIIQTQDVVTERVVTQFRDRIVQRTGVTTTIEKEVTRYVEGKPLALACMLDTRWVQLHDAAAAGTVPPPAAGTDGVPAGITAAEALPTITGNYGTAHKIRDQLIALQTWVREQFKVTNGAALD